MLSVQIRLHLTTNMHKHVGIAFVFSLYDSKDVGAIINRPTDILQRATNSRPYNDIPFGIMSANDVPTNS